MQSADDNFNEDTRIFRTDKQTFRESTRGGRGGAYRPRGGSMTYMSSRGGKSNRYLDQTRHRKN